VVPGSFRFTNAGNQTLRTMLRSFEYTSDHCPYDMTSLNVSFYCFVVSIWCNFHVLDNINSFSTQLCVNKRLMDNDASKEICACYVSTSI
jgi:hypothetical protein